MKIRTFTSKAIKNLVSGQIDPINLKQFFERNPILPLQKPESLKIDEFSEEQVLFLFDNFDLSQNRGSSLGKKWPRGGENAPGGAGGRWETVREGLRNLLTKK